MKRTHTNGNGDSVFVKRMMGVIVKVVVSVTKDYVKVFALTDGWHGQQIGSAKRRKDDPLPFDQAWGVKLALLRARRVLTGKQVRQAVKLGLRLVAMFSALNREEDLLLAKNEARCRADPAGELGAEGEPGIPSAEPTAVPVDEEVTVPPANA